MRLRAHFERSSNFPNLALVRTKPDIQLDVDPSLVKDVLAEARKRLTLAAEYNRDELLGTALTRLNDLYSRCIRAGADGNGPNLAKALDVQREINRLVGLYRQTSLLPGQGADGGGEASDELRAIGEPAAADFPSAWRTKITRSANTRGWRRRRSVNIKQPKQSPYGQEINSENLHPRIFGMVSRGHQDVSGIRQRRRC